MAEPYTIHIFVVDGDPDGVKIVDRQNWTGWGIAFPRSSWTSVCKRKEFGTPGVYILSGPSEGSSDELPTVYVGQGDEIRTRLDSHFVNKDFWDWGYAFVSKGTALNRAHTTWLEHALIDLAHQAGQCHLDNATHPKEPNLSEWERADTLGFLGRDPTDPAPARRPCLRGARPGGDGEWRRVSAGGCARGPARHRGCARAGRRLPRGVPRPGLLVRNPY